MPFFMKITIEKTFTGKVSRNVVNNVDGVYITHLPNTHSLNKVVEEADDINQYAGKNIAVPHCAARNIHTASEFINFIAKCQEKNISKILVVGGSIQKGNVFQSVDDLLLYNNTFSGFELECGVYPQKESFTQMHEKLKSTKFVGGITQLCMDTRLLNKIGIKFNENVKIGIPSMCSIKGLWHYLKLCGNKSPKYMLENWKGCFYLKADGFDVKKFVSKVNHTHFHIYNFGKLEKTVETLTELALQ